MKRRKSDYKGVENRDKSKKVAKCAKEKDGDAYTWQSPCEIVLKEVLQLADPQNSKIVIVYGIEQYNMFVEKFQRSNKKKVKTPYVTFFDCPEDNEKRQIIVVRGDCWKYSVTFFPIQLAWIWKYEAKYWRPLIVTVNPPMGITKSARSASNDMKILHCCTAKSFYSVMESGEGDVTREMTDEVYFAANVCVGCFESIENCHAKKMSCDHIMCVDCAQENVKCPARIYETSYLHDEDSSACFCEAPVILKQQSANSDANDTNQLCYSYEGPALLDSQSFDNDQFRCDSEVLEVNKSIVDYTDDIEYDDNSYSSGCMSEEFMWNDSITPLEPIYNFDLNGIAPRTFDEDMFSESSSILNKISLGRKWPPPLSPLKVQKEFEYEGIIPPGAGNLFGAQGEGFSFLIGNV